MPPDVETLNSQELEQLRACHLGKEVAVADIGREFSQLWDQDETATRASLINFAIYNEQLGALLENTRLIQEITLEHACRALLIMSLPGKKAHRVRAWITAHCQLDAAGKKVACSEQVAFLVEGTDSDLIRNIVFAHLDSDLPLVLWWQGALNARFEERLYSSVDRLIVDSASWEDPQAGYNTLVSALENDRSRFIVHDLAWTRSYQFRIALASCFDDPALRSRLSAVDSVAMETAAGHETAALLLLGWLAAQSGWSLKETHLVSGTHTCTFEKEDPGTQVRAQITAVKLAAPLQFLKISGGDFSVAIKRELDCDFLQVAYALQDRKESRILPAAGTDLVDLVSGQLMRGGNNQLFFKILPSFRALLQSSDQVSGIGD